MEYLLSALYTIVDVACLLLFLSAFAAPRFVRHKQWLLSGAYFTTIYLILCLNMTLFEYNMSLKVTLVLACGFLFGAHFIYKYFHPLCIFPCPSGVSVDLSLLLYWSASIRPGVRCKCISVSPWSPCRLHHFFRYLLFFASSFYSFHRKNGQQPKDPERQLEKAIRSEAILYVLFPLASFIMLLVLLRATSKQGLPDGFMIACCWMIFIANAAILYLLDQSEKERLNREQLLSLNQQLQLQEKNAKELVGLYSSQRKQIHDFRAHLNMLDQLLSSQQYDAANHYIHSVSAQQTERIFLVNCHHAVLDALFNSKASEALRKDIDLHFEVNDLFPFPQ